MKFQLSERYFFKWTASKNALIELIYALYISNSIADKNIREIARTFEYIFNMNLGDIHNAFHKMKFREKGVTLFLDKLKQNLESHIEEE